MERYIDKAVKIILEIVNWNAYRSQANNINVNRDQEGPIKVWSRLQDIGVFIATKYNTHQVMMPFKIQFELREKMTL